MKNSGKLLVTIDLGNSSATYAIYSGRTLLTSNYMSSYNIPFLAKNIASSGVKGSFKTVIISSVVPILTIKLMKLMGRYISRKSIYVVGRDICPRIPMKYNRKLLGADRLVNIYGALRLYNPPFLVIDYGTAITFDYVSKRGIFVGGLIVPGIEISQKALQAGTALLPKIKKIGSSKELVGKDTKSAMTSGLLNGFGALSDGLIERFKKRYGRKLMVIATGGFAEKIAPYTHGIDRVDPLHTIRSLALIYQNEIEET